VTATRHHQHCIFNGQNVSVSLFGNGKNPFYGSKIKENELTAPMSLTKIQGSETPTSLLIPSSEGTLLEMSPFPITMPSNSCKRIQWPGILENES
jgi:hypothetical protein